MPRTLQWCTITCDDWSTMTCDDWGVFQCCCQSKVLASTVTNFSHPIWDLTLYQGPGQADPGSFWRIIELGHCYPFFYPWYFAGCVDAYGELAGLPNQFVSPYSYDGFLDLQIGCANGDTISWPGTCQTETPRSAFPC